MLHMHACAMLLPARTQWWCGCGSEATPFNTITLSCCQVCCLSWAGRAFGSSLPRGAPPAGYCAAASGLVAQVMCAKCRLPLLRPLKPHTRQAL